LEKRSERNGQEKAAEEAIAQITKTSGAPAKIGKRRYLTKKRHQFIEIFMSLIYSGMEYSIGFWIVIVLQEARNMPLAIVGMFPAVYYGGLMVGRMAFGYIAGKMSDTAMIRVGLGLAFIGTIVLMLSYNSFVSLAGIALAGIGFAPIFPCIMHDTANRFVPRLLTKLVGYEVAANAAGIMILSSIKGPILANTSLELLFPMMRLILITLLFNEILERAVKHSAAIAVAQAEDGD